jgi:predicted DNA-binding antitoxin AbrB/MazE fold protein
MDKEEVSMAKTIDAVYEHGILRPLEKLDLKESQRLKLTLEVLRSVVEETQALIRARADVVKEVAEHDEYLLEGEALRATN